MLVRKPAIVYSSCTASVSVHYCHHHHHHNHRHHHSSPSGSPCRRAFAHPRTARQARSYAGRADSSWDRANADLLRWPDAVKPHLTPTPYQILQCSRGVVYSKSRFCALVKLYHPDRCHVKSGLAHLPPHVRLERYRLLVAAHDILSDAEKRRAYDIWGHGWPGHGGSSSQVDQRSWASDPRNNGTWEDWERWRKENEGSKEPDEPTVHMSNFAFIALILACASVGGVVQKTRLASFSSSVMEKRDEMHREAATGLRRSQDASTSGDRDGRIRTFVAHREFNMPGEALYDRLPPPPPPPPDHAPSMSPKGSDGNG